jgi:hypothetical protein
MKFYKGQIGPVTNVAAYALALREMAKVRDMCFPSRGASENEVREAIAKLSDEDLVDDVQIAAKLSSANEEFAERWFLQRLGLIK